ncbi:MAG TPA: M20 family metallopeptidase [Stellaceae bacterium]|nr:M20 family metallopeptidase [Stellaceae bacterium]
MDRQSTALASNQAVLDAEELLEGIRRWVTMESPSHDGAAVTALMAEVERDWQGAGALTERVPGRDGFGDHLVVRSPWGGDGPGILVVSHLDTVHPHGTLADINPLRREGDKVYGPGIYDMKAGAHLAFAAFRHLRRTGRTTDLPITFLIVSDEEVGSKTSRALIEAEGRKAKYVLVTEPARDGGKIVTSRKGIAQFKLKLTGRAAHAGTQHDKGRSAVIELSRQVLDIAAMTDYARGVTTNVGIIQGGTTANTIAQHSRAEIDLRIPTPELADEMVARLLALKAHDPDVALEITGGINRPPYVKDAAITQLFDHARVCAAELGMDLRDVPMTGGGSDGNFTAALGVPTLDGLGADGAGAHTDDEHIFYSSLVPRASLLLRLMETLR